MAKVYIEAADDSRLCIVRAIYRPAYIRYNTLELKAIQVITASV
jgi:hypothetical protein